MRQSAFAIPCRLYQIYPINGNEQSKWKSNDLVHDEFNRLMGNMVSCKVCGIEDQKCYDVEIDIPSKLIYFRLSASSIILTGQFTDLFTFLSYVYIKILGKNTEHIH